MITVYEEKQLDFDGLYKSSWGGAVQVLDKVKEKGLEDELMNLLEELQGYEDGQRFDRTRLNDFICFDLDNCEPFENLWDDDYQGGTRE